MMLSVSPAHIRQRQEMHPWQLTYTNYLFTPLQIDATGAHKKKLQFAPLH